MSSHAQIGPQGAEKQLSKVNVGGWVGGGGGGMQPITVTAIALQSLVNSNTRENPINRHQYHYLHFLN